MLWVWARWTLTFDSQGLEKDFNEAGFKVQVKQLADFQDAYGLEGDEDDEVDDDEDEDDEDDEGSDDGEESDVEMKD